MGYFTMQGYLTAIDAFWLLVSLATAWIAYFVSSLFAEFYLSILVAAIGLALPIAAAKLLEYVLPLKRPPYPICETGVCTWDHYRVAKREVSQELLYICECGNTYVMREKHF